MVNSRGMGWAGHVECLVRRDAYRLLVENPEVKGPLEKPRRRWEDNVKVDLR
jgi:hypothetical protein